jgi:DNA-binding CsgD family transcriptional regulator
VLTEREKEILKWTAAGKSTARIGDLLLISENTVSNHLKNIRVKMGVSTTTHAVAKALVERIIFL